MKQQKFSDRFSSIFDMALAMAEESEADAILVMMEGPTDWEQLRQRQSKAKIIVAGDTPEVVDGAAEHELPVVILDMTDGPVYEKLTQAVFLTAQSDGRETVASNESAPASQTKTK